MIIFYVCMPSSSFMHSFSLFISILYLSFTFSTKDFIWISSEFCWKWTSPIWASPHCEEWALFFASMNNMCSITYVHVEERKRMMLCCCVIVNNHGTYIRIRWINPPVQSVWAGSGKKESEINGIWKQHSKRNIAGFFQVTSDQVSVLFRWKTARRHRKKSDEIPLGILLPCSIDF